MLGARSIRLLLALAFTAFVPSMLRAQCLDWHAFPDGSHLVRNLGSSIERFDSSGVKRLYLIAHTPGAPVIRWDGTLIEVAPGGLNGQVNQLLAFDDGNGMALYAGGASLTIFGVAAGALARFDGFTWTAISGLTMATVSQMVVHDDGSGPELIVSGESTPVFTAGTLTTNSQVARWTGSTWIDLAFPSTPKIFYPSTFGLVSADLGSGPSLFVASAQTAGRLFQWTGGVWSIVPGSSTTTISKLDAMDDGAGRSVFTVEVVSGVWAVRRWNGIAWSTIGVCGSLLIDSIDVVDDNGVKTLYVGGRANPAVPRIHTWNGTTFSATTPAYVDSCAYDQSPSLTGLASIDFGAGPVLIASSRGPGLFGHKRTALTVRVNGQWQEPGDVQGGLSGGVQAMTVMDLGSGPRLYVGGIFCYADSLDANSLGSWDGHTWSTISPSTGFGGRWNALTSYVSAAGTQLACGGFGVALTNGSQLTGIITPSGPSSVVYSLKQFGSDLYVGGAFLYLNGIPTPNIGKWNGTSVVAMDQGMNGAVNALATFDDGSGAALYAGGSFTIANGSFMPRIARWNGANWSPLGSGLNGLCDALVVFDDGSGTALYAAGTFTNAGGVPASCVARWKNNAWSAVGAGLNAQVLTLGVFDDGSGPALYAGGNFTTSGSTPLERIARWNGTSWTGLGGGVDGSVCAIQSFDSGNGAGAELFVGGTFHKAANQNSNYIAAWRGCSGPISRYCFGDGTVAPCPCGNQGLAARGCDNSLATGGARMNANGSMSPDTIEFYLAGLIPGTAAMLFQGDTALSAPFELGDGLLCAGGNIRRLEVAFSPGGTLGFPTGASSISAQSAAAGDPLVPGNVRGYQAWYRDSNPLFCTPATSNLSNAVRIVW